MREFLGNYVQHNGDIGHIGYYFATGLQVTIDHLRYLYKKKIQ